jgi:hypothetical protein
MATLVPYWVVVIFILMGIVCMNWYVEGVILMLLIGYMAHGFTYDFGYLWVLFGVILIVWNKSIIRASLSGL